MYVVRVQAAALYLFGDAWMLRATPDRNRAKRFATREQAEGYLQLARDQFPWEWVVESVEG